MACGGGGMRGGWRSPRRAGLFTTQGEQHEESEAASSVPEREGVRGFGGARRGHGDQGGGVCEETSRQARGGHGAGEAGGDTRGARRARTDGTPRFGESESAEAVGGHASMSSTRRFSG